MQFGNDSKHVANNMILSESLYMYTRDVRKLLTQHKYSPLRVTNFSENEHKH